MRWYLIIWAGFWRLSEASDLTELALKSKNRLRSSAELDQRQPTDINFPSHFLHHIDARQTTGRCGPTAGGASCLNNQCCSEYDYCGSDADHCAALVGCQPQYGRCGDAAADPTTTLTPTPTPTPIPTPSPPSSSAAVPPSSSIPPSISSPLPPVPSSTLVISLNGQCGNTTTCAGSTFGSCCSNFFYCGTGSQYCGTGCRSAFGTCDSVAPLLSSSVVPVASSSSIRTAASSISTPTPIPTLISTVTPTPIPFTPSVPAATAPAVPTNVSRNGRCGADGSGATCIGSTNGRCCSSYGYCGVGDDYCRVSYGCQAAFGTCG